MTIEKFGSQHERHARDLWGEINKLADPNAYFPTLFSFQLFDMKTRELDEGITGRAQSARCIYCNKTITSWGAAPKGKKSKSRSRGDVPDALAEASETHSVPCAETWLWAVLARWAIDANKSRPERDGVFSWHRDILARNRRDDGHWRYGDDRFIIDMFSRLPSRDPEVLQSIELGVEGSGFEFRQELPKGWRLFKHGTTEQNPHMLFPIVFGDAERGVWGQCTCGHIDWRGPEWAGKPEPMPMYFNAAKIAIGVGSQQRAPL